MKVIKLTDEDSADYLEEKERIAIGTLKLAGDRNYVKDIGVRDGDFYLLEETQDDADYISWVRDSIEGSFDTGNPIDLCCDVCDVGDTSDGRKKLEFVFFKYAWGKKCLFRALIDLGKHSVSSFDEINILLKRHHGRFVPDSATRTYVNS